MKMTFNGKRITSSGQLSREFEKSITAAVDRRVRTAAPPGVRVKKTPTGYVAEGDEKGIQRMLKRLER
jgi:hypothetical protein